jgi:H/ACA ribonucleoprotein complex subunit 4
MKEDGAASLFDIKDAYVFWQQHGREEWIRSVLRPIEVLADPLPKIIVKASAVDAVCHGADLNIRGIHMLDEDIRKNAMVALMTARGELVAIGTVLMSSPKIMASSQGKAVKVTRVMMAAGRYPRMWKFSTDLEELSAEKDTL